MRMQDNQIMLTKDYDMIISKADRTIRHMIASTYVRSELRGKFVIHKIYYYLR